VKTVAESRWNGVGVTVFECQWTTGTGDHVLYAEQPTLYVILDEIGGRCELRDTPAQAPRDYFGPGALGFAPAGASILLHPCRSREVRLGAFAFCTARITELSPDFGMRLERAGLKLMFEDERVRECAALLAAESERHENPPPYGAGLALSLLAAIVDATTNPQPLRGRRLSYRQFTLASEYIEERCKHPVLLEDVARVVGLAPAKFASSFKSSTGMSLQRWQMRVRVYCAQRMMLDDYNRSLTEIATVLGFADQSHFSRTFTQLVGITPREWLRRRS
jgi:AraC family transcriptional regulator